MQVHANDSVRAHARVFACMRMSMYCVCFQASTASYVCSGVTCTCTGLWTFNLLSQGFSYRCYRCACLQAAVCTPSLDDVFALSDITEHLGVEPLVDFREDIVGKMDILSSKRRGVFVNGLYSLDFLLFTCCFLCKPVVKRWVLPRFIFLECTRITRSLSFHPERISHATKKADDNNRIK